MTEPGWFIMCQLTLNGNLRCVDNNLGAHSHNFCACPLLLPILDVPMIIISVSIIIIVVMLLYLFINMCSKHCKGYQWLYSIHFSVIRSFRITTAAMEIPGLWALPALCLLWWSLWDATVDNTRKKLGALPFRSSIRTFQVKLSYILDGIFLNSDGWGLSWQSVVHSALISSRNCRNTNSRSSLCDTMLFASDGR